PRGGGGVGGGKVPLVVRIPHADDLRKSARQERQRQTSCGVALRIDRRRGAGTAERERDRAFRDSVAATADVGGDRLGLSQEEQLRRHRGGSDTDGGGDGVDDQGGGSVTAIDEVAGRVGVADRHVIAAGGQG